MAGWNGRRVWPSGRVPRGDRGWKLMMALWLVVSAASFLVWRHWQAHDPADGENGAPFWLPGAEVTLPDYVEQDFLPVNPYSRPGRYLEKINGVVIHYVGNPGSSARANRDYFASLRVDNTDTYASSHFVVGLDGEVIQCVPLTEVSYASNHRNGDTIAIEVCHPDAEGRFSDVTYARVVELTAWLCGTFDIDVEEGVIRHYDVTGKNCPRYYVEHPKAWDQFKAHVSEKLDAMRRESTSE